jgi:hypothetical protein
MLTTRGGQIDGERYRNLNGLPGLGLKLGGASWDVWDCHNEHGAFWALVQFEI